MERFGTLLTRHLGEIGMTKYRLAKLSGIAESTVVQIAGSKRRASGRIIDAFARVPALGLERERLLGWRALDDYSVEAIREAVRVLRAEGVEI